MRSLVRLMIDLLRQDTRTAVRTLWKHRGFTAFATLSLALGIGANTALFSLVDRLLLRSLPVSEPDRLVEVQQTISRLGIHKAITGASPAAFEAVRAHPEIFSAVVGFEYLDRPEVRIGGAVEPNRRLAQVSANFFRDLGIQPSVGRVPAATDDAVAIVSDAWWRERFGARADALGRAMTVDGESFTIVGVAPARVPRPVDRHGHRRLDRVARTGHAADDRAPRAGRRRGAGTGGGGGGVPAARAGAARGDAVGRRHAAPRSCRPDVACRSSGSSTSGRCSPSRPSWWSCSSSPAPTSATCSCCATPGVAASWRCGWRWGRDARGWC